MDKITKLKIMFPIGSFFPCQIGGQASAVLWHVTALGMKNMNCAVYTTINGIRENEVSPDTSVYTEYGQVYYCKNLFSIKNFQQLYSQIKNTDIVHLSGMFNIPSTLCLIFWALFFNHKKIICSVHGELNPNALKFSRLKKQPTLLLYRLLYRKILFHSTSDAEYIDVQNFFKNSNVIQIPNLMFPATQVKNIKTKKQFLFMGRIHEIKALHKFIEALGLSKLFKSSDFIFDITGTHEERHEAYYKKLKELIDDLGLAEKVKFSGHLSGISKEQKYAESYFLVLPSETENFGNVVVEALNQKTPVLAALGTPWKVLEEYNCGFHTDNTPKNLARYIDRIISLDPLQYNALCANTSRLVDDQFNIETQISKWVNIYNAQTAGKI